MENSIKMNAKGWLRAGIGAWVLVLVVIVGWFYSAAMPTVLIDNPTSDDIVVNINNTDYNVSAGSYEKIKLPFGSAEYKVLVNNQEVGSFKKGMLDGAALINPTLSTYVKETVFYVSDLDSDAAKKDAKVEQKTVCVNGMNYDGNNLVAYTDLYIKKDWNYGIENVSPDTMKPNKWPKNVRYAMIDELFNEKDFTDSNSGYGSC